MIDAALLAAIFTCSAQHSQITVLLRGASTHDTADGTLAHAKSKLVEYLWWHVLIAWYQHSISQMRLLLWAWAGTAPEMARYLAWHQVLIHAEPKSALAMTCFLS